MIWLFELIFLLMMLCILALFLFSLLFAWAWAIRQDDKKLGFLDILSVAAIEWGAFLTLLVSHLRPPQHFFEAPPQKDKEFSAQQLPIIFVPSLHMGSAIFGFLTWRLEKNFWNSLWHFQWKSFLQSPKLLEDQLQSFIQEVIAKTKAKRFRIVSFGTSRPLISRVLGRPDLAAYCDKWIAVSAPEQLSKSLKFISSTKAKGSYKSAQPLPRHPDLLIIGDNDFFCESSDFWGQGKQVFVPHVGHFGTALHALTTQNIIRELHTP